MNAVDVVLALVVVASVWGGWRRGLLVAGTNLLTLAVSLIGAFLLYPRAVTLAGRQGSEWDVWLAPAAFLLVYVLVWLTLGALLRRPLGSAPDGLHGHAANRVLGVIPGAANGLINATIVSMLLVVLPLSDGVTRIVSGSVLADRLTAPAEWLEFEPRTLKQYCENDVMTLEPSRSVICKNCGETMTTWSATTPRLSSARFFPSDNRQ